MPTTLSAQVGVNAANKPADVKLVQQLLNKHRSQKLAEDGLCGPNTIAAIRQF
jgi:lysozyme family protein